MENAELIEKIADLKEQRQAVILAHNYQSADVQDVADFVGDSLELSQTAAGTEARVIVFCGVHFMAETASILSPDKTVLLPDINAGCPMANMVTASQLRDRKRELAHASTVCYVNSSAKVKAESDICCTSANAVTVVESLDSNQILFVPDQYLGHYVSTKTDKKITLWSGYCPTHARIMPEDIFRLRQGFPQAKVIVHPECRPEVINLADEVLSTSGMTGFARRTDAEVIIVGTEVGILHRLVQENPTKTFLPASERAVCPNMKKINLEKILLSLEQLSPEVKVPEEIRLKAKRAVDRMLAIGRAD